MDLTSERISMREKIDAIASSKKLDKETTDKDFSNLQSSWTGATVGLMDRKQADDAISKLKDMKKKRMSNLQTVSPDRYATRKRKKSNQPILHQENIYPMYKVYLDSQEQKKVNFDNRQRKSREKSHQSFLQGE